MILLSSCLAGYNVRYNGSNAMNKVAYWLATHGQAITVCPEIMSGLQTPRPSAEIVGGKAKAVFEGSACVQEDRGQDVSENFMAGAELVRKIVKDNQITVAFLKDKSPSCGVNYVYDGTFNGQIVPGMGVTAQLLKEQGVKIFADSELSVENVVEFVDSNLQELFIKENGQLT